jgi:hypothetical protein
LIAEQLKDLDMMYKKLSWLAQLTYPKYQQNKAAYGFEKAPICRMRVGDLFKYENSGLAGYLTDLSPEYDLALG